MRKTRVRKEPLFEVPDDTETGAVRLKQGYRRADALVVLMIVLAAGTIAVNALFLQSGSHPAPILAAKPAAPAVRHVAAAPAAVLPRPRPRPRERETVRSELLAPAPTPITASITHPEPKIAPVRTAREPSKRVMIVQRVLAEFGYGQIKTTGHIDDDTRQAIERFERQHKLPVTGEVSDRLTKKITAMTGQSFE